MNKKGFHSFSFLCLFIASISLLVGCWGLNAPDKSSPEEVQIYYGENIKPQYLIRPTALTVDSQGNIYVVDRHSVTGFIKKFDSQGKFLYKFASLGLQKGQLQTPVQLAVDDQDNVYITDAGAVTGVDRKRKVLKYNSQGKFQQNLISFPDLSEQTGYYGPTGISIANNQIYLTNVDRIQKFDFQGKKLMEFGQSTTGFFGIFLSDYIYGPESIATEGKGYSYVLDTYSGLIRLFNAKGKQIKQFEPRPVEITEPLKGDLEVVGNSLFFLDSELGELTKFNLQGKVIWKVGSKGSKQNQFFNPTDVYIDKKGFIYVADSGNRSIKKLNSQGTVVAEIGKPSSETVFFSQPGEVGVDRKENIYVADTGNNRIVKLDPQGNVRLIVRGENSPKAVLGDNRGKLFYPSGVAIDSKGNIYVADYDYNRKQKFTSAGKLLFSFGPAGDLALDQKDNIYLGNGTYYIKFNPELKKIVISENAQQESLYNQGNLVVNNKGQVFMVDRTNSQIKKFSSSGKLLNTFGKAGSQKGEFLFPNGIALGPDGNIYVADAGNHRIQTFSPDGKFIKVVGKYGSGKGELNFPQGVVVDSKGNIYVADTDNQRIVKIKK